jgi:hypothetical protein
VHNLLLYQTSFFFVSVTVRDLSPQNKNTNRLIKFLHPSACFFFWFYKKNGLTKSYFKVSHNEKLHVATLTCTSLASKAVPLHATEGLVGEEV